MVPKGPGVEGTRTNFPTARYNDGSHIRHAKGVTPSPWGEGFPQKPLPPTSGVGHSLPSRLAPSHLPSSGEARKCTSQFLRIKFVRIGACRRPYTKIDTAYRPSSGPAGPTTFPRGRHPSERSVRFCNLAPYTPSEPRKRGPPPPRREAYAPPEVRFYPCSLLPPNAHGGILMRYHSTRSATGICLGPEAILQGLAPTAACMCRKTCQSWTFPNFSPALPWTWPRTFSPLSCRNCP